MTAKVGIPRALGYYYLYPFYKTFLEHLGMQVVVSAPTTKATLDRMEVCPTDEPCVAVKLYFAHTEKLVRQELDYIFSPVLVSVEKDNFCCPKFLGISDMIRNGLELDEAKFLAPRFDYRDDQEESAKPFLEMAAKLGVTDRGKVHSALKAAEQVQREFEELMATKRLTIPEAIRLLDGAVGRSRASHAPSLISHQQPATPDPKSRIGVIGHPYILYDMLSHDMVDLLRQFGEAITAEMVRRGDVEEQMNGIPGGNKMWSFEAHMLGAALHLLRNRLVDKIILVGSFECGPESIIEAYVEQEAEIQGIPFLLLTIDEQTGEAGLITRIEAFMDTASPTASDLRRDDTETGGERPEEMGRGTEGPREIHNTKSQIPNPKSEIRDEEMVVGFPAMGFLDIAIKAWLEDCGTKCLRTPPMSKRSIELGTELAPEFVCFPLTATLGQMRELLEKGANTIFMVGGKGRCRLGWYAQVQEKILRKAGYDFQMMALDSPVPFRTHWRSFSETIKWVTGGASWPRIIKGFYFGYRKMAALDHAEAICHRMRAIERDRGVVDRLFDRFVRRIDRVSDIGTIAQETREFEEAVRAIEIEDTDPLKVRIVGEIWVVLEHFVNQEIEKMLATREGLRVEVDRELSASHWFRLHILSDPTLKARERHIRHAASRFLSEQVGGHGQESVGATVLAHEEGCDGVIHIFPFTCMPEIVAQNILVRVSEELDIPVLTFIVSEQTGEAGIQTRVEAFLDVLEERRRHRRATAGQRNLRWRTT